MSLRSLKIRFVTAFLKFCIKIVTSVPISEMFRVTLGQLALLILLSIAP